MGNFSRHTDQELQGSRSSSSLTRDLGRVPNYDASRLKTQPFKSHANPEYGGLIRAALRTHQCNRGQRSGLYTRREIKMHVNHIKPNPSPHKIGAYHFHVAHVSLVARLKWKSRTLSAQRHFCGAGPSPNHLTSKPAIFASCKLPSRPALTVKSSTSTETD
jgi:hypothetical protein